MPEQVLSLTPADLYPKEVSRDLPIQAQVMARVSYGRLTDADMRALIARGILDDQDNPDQVNQIATKGW